MNRPTTVLLTALLGLTLTGCGQSGDPHSHGDAGGEHAQEDAGDTHHGTGDHGHDEPETEAYYGERAESDHTDRMHAPHTDSDSPHRDGHAEHAHEDGGDDYQH